MKGKTGWRGLFAAAFFAGDWERVVALAPAVKEAAARAAQPAYGRTSVSCTVAEAEEISREWLKIALG